MAVNILHANDRDGHYPDSLYRATAAPLPESQPLEGTVHTQVCVVGAGYCGLSAALFLAQSGRDVTVLEAHRVAWGASGRNGGQVSGGQRLDQDSLERMLPPGDAKWLWEMGQSARALVRDIAEAHDIECEITPGIISADHRRRYVRGSKKYARKIQEEYGYREIRFLDRDEIRALVASEDYHGGTIDSAAFHLNPLKFGLGLARAAIRAGARIHENSEVVSWRADRKYEIRTASARVYADHLVFACNGYLGLLEPEIAARVMPINNFVIATERLGRSDANGLIPGREAVSDSRFVINYFRLSEDDRLLFGGGESYGYRFPEDIAGFVRKRMLQIFPQLAGASIEYAWGGTLAITRNRLPHFRRTGANCWSVSGFSGHGISIATMAGRLVADAIGGRTGDFERMEKYRSGRFPGGVRLRAPLLALAMYWYAMRDRL